jgi:hypothetical protein
MSLSAFLPLLFFLVLLSGSQSALRAQSTNDSQSDQSTNPVSSESVSKSAIREMTQTGPQADSPFYIEREEAKAAMAEEGQKGFGMYIPKPPHPPVRQQIKRFFHSLFGFEKKKKPDGGTHPLFLTVTPSDIPLSKVSELNVTLKISNAQKKMIELLYPNNQRLEILTKDATGNVITRWSQDRIFDQVEGFVAINPSEYIVYSEKVPTGGMKAGETYTIEVSVAGQQGYTTKTTVKPTL